MYGQCTTVNETLKHGIRNRWAIVGNLVYVLLLYSRAQQCVYRSIQKHAFRCNCRFPVRSLRCHMNTYMLYVKDCCMLHDGMTVVVHWPIHRKHHHTHDVGMR